MHDAGAVDEVRGPVDKVQGQVLRGHRAPPSVRRRAPTAVALVDASDEREGAAEGSGLLYPAASNSTRSGVHASRCITTRWHADAAPGARRRPIRGVSTTCAGPRASPSIPERRRTTPTRLEGGETVVPLLQNGHAPPIYLHTQHSVAEAMRSVWRTWSISATARPHPAPIVRTAVARWRRDGVDCPSAQRRKAPSSHGS